MDALTLFGLVAVSLMLLFYALDDKSHSFVLAFAGSCVLGSAYGFLQGAWPFGLVKGAWSVVAAWRWRALRSQQRRSDFTRQRYQSFWPGRRPFR